MSGTVIPTITPAQFAARLAALFPRGWASPDALKSGNAYALLSAFGTVLNQVLGQIQYARNAVLIPTETSPELDLASEDFFGSSLPRPPGMSDAAFANLILSQLFQGAVSRPSISRALTQLTGKVPRMIEPWAPGDTGAWNASVTYWNVDTRANPFRWSGERRFTGFIQTAPAPTAPVLNGNPVNCWNDGLYWNVNGCSFMQLQINSASNVFALINRLRAYGITVGVMIVQNPQ